MSLPQISACEAIKGETTEGRLICKRCTSVFHKTIECKDDKYGVTCQENHHTTEEHGKDGTKGSHSQKDQDQENTMEKVFTKISGRAIKDRKTKGHETKEEPIYTETERWPTMILKDEIPPTSTMFPVDDKDLSLNSHATDRQKKRIAYNTSR